VCWCLASEPPNAATTPTNRSSLGRGPRWFLAGGDRVNGFRYTHIRCEPPVFFSKAPFGIASCITAMASLDAKRRALLEASSSSDDAPLLPPRKEKKKAQPKQRGAKVAAAIVHTFASNHPRFRNLRMGGLGCGRRRWQCSDATALRHAASDTYIVSLSNRSPGRGQSRSPRASSKRWCKRGLHNVSQSFV
jgi:hypothetical protein